MSSSLIELANQKIILWQTILDSGGELSSETEAWLEKVETELPTKVDQYKFVLDELSDQEERLRKQAQELTLAARTLSTIQEKMKDRIKYVMDKLGETEINGESHRFVLSKSRPKLVITDADLPENFKMIETKTVPDKEKIQAAIDLGMFVSGVTLEEVKTLRTYVRKTK